MEEYLNIVYAHLPYGVNCLWTNQSSVEVMSIVSRLHWLRGKYLFMFSTDSSVVHNFPIGVYAFCLVVKMMGCILSGMRRESKNNFLIPHIPKWMVSLNYWRSCWLQEKDSAWLGPFPPLLYSMLWELNLFLFRRQQKKEFWVNSLVSKTVLDGLRTSSCSRNAE